MNVVLSHFAHKYVVRMICFHCYGSEMFSLRFMAVMPLILVTTTFLLENFFVYLWLKYSELYVVSDVVIFPLFHYCLMFQMLVVARISFVTVKKYAFNCISQYNLH